MHTAQEKPISLVPDLDMKKLVYIAAGVCIPRYQLHAVLHPSSATSLPPIHESQTCERRPRLPNLAEVLIRPYTPRSQKRDESGARSTPIFPGKLVVPDEAAGDDEWFPMYGSHSSVATARSTCKRKRDVEPEENHYLHHFGCSQTPYSPLASPKRARLDACMFNGSYAEVELQALQ